MQNNRFVVLTGHLRNYPLSDLVGILRHQRKSGRLTIEYPKGPATFFFNEGELVDAQLRDLTGLQAVCVALAQPEAAFNFNPLIRPSRRSIEPSLQRVVCELFGCWDESALQIDGTATRVESERPAAIESHSKTPEAFPHRAEPLQLLAAPSSGIQRRSVLFMAASGLLMLGLSTVIAVTGTFNSAQRVPERANGATRDNAPASSSSPPQAEIERRIMGAGGSKVSRALDHRQETRSLPVKLERNKQSESSHQTPSETTSAVVSTEQVKTPTETATAVQSVHVIMQIENGRVLRAAIADHKPGMDSYEGLALRIARQRRYGTKVSGQESVTISVARPN